jgi:hypothetical protein
MLPASHSGVGVIVENARYGQEDDEVSLSLVQDMYPTGTVVDNPAYGVDSLSSRESYIPYPADNVVVENYLYRPSPRSEDIYYDEASTYAAPQAIEDWYEVRPQGRYLAPPPTDRYGAYPPREEYNSTDIYDDVRISGRGTPPELYGGPLSYNSSRSFRPYQVSSEDSDPAPVSRGPAAPLNNAMSMEWDYTDEYR